MSDFYNERQLTFDKAVCVAGTAKGSEVYWIIGLKLNAQ